MDDIKAPTAPVAAPVEAPAVEAPKTGGDDAFAKKERQIRAMQKQLQAEKAAWQAEKAAKDTEYKTNYVNKNRLKEDTLGALEEAGITMDQLSSMLLNAPNQNDPTVKMLKAEMKAIKDAQAAQQTAAEQAQTQQYEQAKKQIGIEAKMLIDSDPEFETLKAEGQHEAVLELIVETFENEGRLMDVREACLEVENYLVEQGVKFSSYGKVKSRLAPKEPVQSEPVKAPSKQPQVTLKTLTNNLQTQPSKRSSEKERIARALAAFQGNKATGS